MRRKTEKIISTPLTSGVSAIALALAASLFGASENYASPMSDTEAGHREKPVVLAQLRLGPRSKRRAVNTKNVAIKKRGRGSSRIGTAGRKARRFTITGAKAKRAVRGRKVTRELERTRRLSIGRTSGSDTARLRKPAKAKKTMARGKPKTGARTLVRKTRKSPNIHAARKNGKGLAILTTNRRVNRNGGENTPRQADRLRFLKLLNVNARHAEPVADAAPPAGPVPIPYPVFGHTNSLEAGRSNSANGKPIAVEKIVPAEQPVERARTQGVPFGHTIGIPHEHQNPQSSANLPRTKFQAFQPHGSSSKPLDLQQYGAGLTDFIFTPNPGVRRSVRHPQGRVTTDADFNETTPGGGGYNEISFDDKSVDEPAAVLRKKALPLSGRYSGTYLVKGVSHLARQTGKEIKTKDTGSGTAGKPLLIVAEDVEGEAIATMIVDMPRNGQAAVAGATMALGNEINANLEPDKKEGSRRTPVFSKHRSQLFFQKRNGAGSPNAAAGLTTEAGTTVQGIIVKPEPIILDEPDSDAGDTGDPGGTGEAPCPDPLKHAPGC